MGVCLGRRLAGVLLELVPRILSSATGRFSFKIERLHHLTSKRLKLVTQGTVLLLQIVACA